jgi:hypothetical protein
MRERTEPGGPGWVAWLGAVVLLGCTAVLSFTTLAELAVRGGYADWRRWLWPLTVDAAALVAVRFWLARGLAASARRFGLVLALAMVVLSIAGNALEHWLAGGGLLPAVLGSVPPLVLAAVGLLIDLAVRRPQAPTPVDTVVDTPADTATPAPGAGERLTSADTPSAADIGMDTQASAEARPRPGSALRFDLHPRLMGVELTRLPQAPLSLPVKPGARQALARQPVTAGLDLSLVDRARELIEASERAPGGRRIGRQVLAAELGTSRHQARLQLAHYDNTPAPGAGADITDKEPARA